MPSGYQIGGVCYPTEFEAAVVYAASLPPFTAVPQTNCPFIGVASVSGDADFPYIQVTWKKVGTASCTNPAPTPIPWTAVGCSVTDPFRLSFPDAALVTGAVLSCWLLAYGIRATRSVLRSTETE